MTTAHRPTFDPAKGKEAQRGPAYHQRLLPAHTHLKQRKRGQGGIGGLSTTPSSTTPNTASTTDSSSQDPSKELTAPDGSLKRKTPPPPSTDPNDEPNASNANGGEPDEDPEAKRRRRILEVTHDDDASTSASDSTASSEAESSDEDEDDEAALRRELEKIKSERLAQRQKAEEAKAAKDREEREYDIARGNPLLNEGAEEDEDMAGIQRGRRDFGVKRRWDDDVVFKNQARGTEEAAKRRGREFVNDALRSDFHRRFMSRYVR
ncbi:MAG: hypothetical protein Q9162_001468 [Coniocarpon cinnabarinum]